MLDWLWRYRPSWLGGDLLAGVVVAMMMIPQAMAYALLAGLPPVAGLYASILPPLCYAVFGSSMTQSVGPMAIVSLMTAAALAPLAAPGSAAYLALAGQLALLTGALLLLCGLLRLGCLANFLSRPVVSGFSNGTALLIAYDQLPVLLGAPPPQLHPPSALLGVAALAALWLTRRYLAAALRRLGLRAALADTGARLAPMLVVLAGVALVDLLDLARAGVRVTGPTPSGLPALALALPGPQWRDLLAAALPIAFIVFLMSMSAAQSAALQRGQILRSNRELIGLGAANLASAASGGLPVTGSLSRSALNLAAGAHTPLASLVTAALLALALVSPGRWLAALPLPVLAATIVVAVLGMVETATLKTAWRYDRADALALLATMAGVLLLGVRAGVLCGVLLSTATLIWRASRPHIAVLGRIAGSEHYRNVTRHQVETWPDILLLRVDGGLFFGNVGAVEQRVEAELLAQPRSRHLVLVLSAVNLIDSTAMLALTELNRTLARRGLRMHLAEVKGPLMDRLRHSELLGELSGSVYLSTALACADLQAA